MGVFVQSISAADIHKIMPAFEWNAVEQNNFAAIAGTWARSAQATLYTGARVENSATQALNDQVALGNMHIFATGTYNATVIYNQDTDYGKFKFYLNNVAKGTEIDAYAGSSTPNGSSTVSLGSLTAGEYVIAIKLTAKNASASAYRAAITSISIIQV